MQTVCDNLARVQERIAVAAEQAGRSATDITLVGVSKYVDAATSALLAQAGCLNLGESRPQQLWDKAADAAFGSLEVNWHMIGHLQRNKVARTVPLSSLIHSVDSLRLLESINQAASSIGKRQAVLIEVNCSGDASKHGFSAEELDSVLPQLADFPSVEVHGLMTMAAGDRSAKAASANFAMLRELRNELAPKAPEGIHLKELSMGMSGDFELAIAEGATIVRVGSALWEGVR